MFDLSGLQVMARVVGLHDADTARVVFLFAGTYKQFVVRIMHIDAPEMASKDTREREAALRARNRLLQLLCPAGAFEIAGTYTTKQIENSLEQFPAIVTLECGEFDKYGRVLSRVVTYTGEDVAEVLMRDGVVHDYEGGTKEKWVLG